VTLKDPPPAQTHGTQAGKPATTSSVAPATASGTVAYGLADAQGAFLNYWSDPKFNKTLKPDVPLSTIRVFVPWDAYATASGTTCIDNTGATNTSAQLAAQSQLYYELEAASPTYDNLNVLIVLSNATTVSTDTATPTDNQYECAFLYLANAVRNSYHYASFAHEYEIYNEPDANPPAMCSDKAAGLYWDAGWMDYYVGNADSLIAGGFGDRAMGGGPDCHPGQFIPNYLGYLWDNVSSLCSYASRCNYPVAISGHPYEDTVNSYASGNNTTQTAYLIQQINGYAYWVGMPVWLTESAVWLTDYNPSSCPAGPGHSDVDSGDNLKGAACVDDSPIHQATAATGWQNLATVPQVARVYWYEFQAGQNYDAGLLAPNGQARPSFCVLTHADGGSPSACAADTNFNDLSHGSPWDQDYNDFDGF
jgi:hypothetical protein